ncbi:MAG: glycosyltransferase, partial [Actinomycetota bacterium]
AARVDVLVANSTFVADSIRRSYGRSAVVVPPPVDVERCGPPRVDHDGYVLVVSRLDPYKRVDLAIRACQEAGLPLRVVGDGVDAARLAGLAGPGVELLGWVDEDRKIELLRGAMALVAPQVEDFGIAMVEALAAGTPVVAPAAGGAVDIVEDGVTGVLYDPDDTEGLSTALARVADLPVDAAVMREASARFAEARFADAMTELVERAVAAPVASA